MEFVQNVNDWKEQLKPALHSKAVEFKMLGYRKTSDDDVWNCLLKKVWTPYEPKHLYEIAQDIFTLAPNTYMGFLAMDVYKEDDLMASIAALTKDK